MGPVMTTVPLEDIPGSAVYTQLIVTCTCCFHSYSDIRIRTFSYYAAVRTVPHWDISGSAHRSDESDTRITVNHKLLCNSLDSACVLVLRSAP